MVVMEHVLTGLSLAVKNVGKGALTDVDQHSGRVSNVFADRALALPPDQALALAFGALSQLFCAVLQPANGLTGFVSNEFHLRFKRKKAPGGCGDLWIARARYKKAYPSGGN